MIVKDTTVILKFCKKIFFHLRIFQDVKASPGSTSKGDESPKTLVKNSKFGENVVKIALVLFSSSQNLLNSRFYLF